MIEKLERVVWLLTPLAQVAVLVTLYARRLLREFKIFALFLAGDVIISALRWSLGGSLHATAYRTVWVITEPFLLVLQTLVVYEFYQLLYRAYPGINAFAKALLLIAVAVALVVTFGTVQLDVGRVTWRFPDVQRLFVVKRVVSSLLGLLMFTTMAFFPRARSAANLRLHGWLLTVLFIAAAGGFFGINFGLASPWMGVLFMSAQLACFVLWAAGLRAPYVKEEQPSKESIARVERLNQDFAFLAKWLSR